MKRRAFLLAGAGAACRRYEDFTLPDAGPAQTGGWTWKAEAAPVLGRGPAGAFDAVDALNPSVVETGAGLHNFYSGFDGKVWRTGAARSADGRTWSRDRVMLEPESSSWERGYIAANGAALWREGEPWYWYQAGSPPRIGLLRGAKKHPEPVLDFGPRGAWDERACADPYVIELGGRLWMYYLGEDRARRQRLGLAVSSDGVVWTKLRRNPVLDLGRDGAFDENGLGEPAVWRARGWYWMLYTGRDRREYRRMGLARSRDGVQWERQAMVIGGEQAWNAKVVCDATVLPGEDRVRVWFGGGDVAHPAENINGQIGYGELTWVPA